jgi:hypothetical protein
MQLASEEEVKEILGEGGVEIETVLVPIQPIASFIVTV